MEQALERPLRRRAQPMVGTQQQGRRAIRHVRRACTTGPCEEMMPRITTARADDQPAAERAVDEAEHGRRCASGYPRGRLLERSGLAGRGMTTKKLERNFLYSTTLGHSKLDIFSAFRPHVYLIWPVLQHKPESLTLFLPAHADPRSAHMADGFPAGAPQHCPMTPQLAGAPAPHLRWRICREEPPPSTCD